jgi:phage terminase large subunit
MICRISTYYKIQAIKKKIKLIQGGQGAGKNVSIAQILIEEGLKKKQLITVMTDTYDNLKDGSITDFRNQFEDSGLDWNSAYNKTDKDLKVGESTIQFRYISDKKAGAGKSKRRDILYINEGNKIGWEVAATYIGRTHGSVYIDYNPDFEFWAHTQIPKLRDKQGNQIYEQIIVTYIDNEMLPDGEVDFIESRRDNVEWFRVYGEGKTGTYSDRRVYSSFTIIEDDAIPQIAKRIPSGMDFGQSPDPTCKVDMYVDGPNVYIDEVFSENNLMPEKIKGAERDSIVDRMNELAVKFAKDQLMETILPNPDDFYYTKIKDYQYTDLELRVLTYVSQYKNWLVIGDSSGATELRDMYKHGFNVRGVSKPAGSQAIGIKRLKSYNIFITKRSLNLKKGLESWFWKVDRNGNIVPEPQGHEPDTLAAARYVMFAKEVW